MTGIDEDDAAAGIEYLGTQLLPLRRPTLLRVTPLPPPQQHLATQPPRLRLAQRVPPAPLPGPSMQTPLLAACSWPSRLAHQPPPLAPPSHSKGSPADSQGSCAFTFSDLPPPPPPHQLLLPCWAAPAAAPPGGGQEQRRLGSQAAAARLQQQLQRADCCPAPLPWGRPGLCQASGPSLAVHVVAP